MGKSHLTWIVCKVQPLTSSWICETGPPPKKSIYIYTYPLVNVYKTMENHHFQWENPLFLWPFSIAMQQSTGGYITYIAQKDGISSRSGCPKKGKSSENHRLRKSPSTQRCLISSSGGSRIITCEPPQLARCCEEHLGCRWAKMRLLPQKRPSNTVIFWVISCYIPILGCVLFDGVYFI